MDSADALFFVALQRL